MTPRNMMKLGGWLLAVIFLLLFWLAWPAKSADRDALMTRLNEYVDDANDRKMSDTNKILILNQVGREYGRRGLYIKRDTIATSANVETYAFNTDFAGGLASAYLKVGQKRKGLPVIGRDSAFRVADVTPGTITYVFVDDDGLLGVHGIPLRAEDIVLLYFAYPGTLDSASAEWDLPDHYEDAALFHAAAKVLFKIPTTEGVLRSQAAQFMGDSLLNELRNPIEQTRQMGVTTR